MNSRFALPLLALLLFVLPALGQTPNPLAEKWVTRLAGAAGYHDVPTATAVDSRGDIYVGGMFGQQTYSYRAAVVKYDGVTGAQIWRWNSPNTRSRDILYDPADYVHVAVGPDDQPVICTDGDGVVKFNGANGAILWNGGGKTEYNSGVYQIAVDADNDVLLAGSIRAFASVTKLNGSTGAQRWEYRSPNRSSNFRAMKLDASGDVYAAGALNDSTETCTVRLTEATGTVVWTSVIPAASGINPVARLLALDSTGGVTVVTYSSVIRYRSSDGGLLWQRNEQTPTTPWDAITDTAGNIYITQGTQTHPSAGNSSNSSYSKYNGATGNLMWRKTNAGPFAGFVTNLAIRGSEVLMYGDYNRGLHLVALDAQTGNWRWSQPLTGQGTSVVTTTTRAVTLMAVQPDGGVVVSGAAQPSTGGLLDIVTARFAPGPSVVLGKTDWVLPTSAQIRVNAAGNYAPSTVKCEYGLTTAYGSETPVQSINTGLFTTGYLFPLKNLAENTTYHARFVGVNARGTTVTKDITFTTGWDANGNKLPDEWELAEFGNTTNRSAAGDSDLDGLKEIVEYALGRRPRVPDSTDVLPVVLDAEGRLSITLTKRPHSTLAVEVSGDLKIWDPAEIVMETETTLVARDGVGGTPRFLRVRAATK